MKKVVNKYFRFALLILCFHVGCSRPTDTPSLPLENRNYCIYFYERSDGINVITKFARYKDRVGSIEIWWRYYYKPYYKHAKINLLSGTIVVYNL